MARCAATGEETDSGGSADDADGEATTKRGRGILYDERCRWDEAAKAGPGMSTTTTPPHHAQHLHPTAMPKHLNLNTYRGAESNIPCLVP